MSHMMKASALKNSGNTNRRENYPTPISLVRKEVRRAVLMWHQIQPRPLRDTPVRVLDIGAGNGAWGIIAKQELEKFNYTVYLVGIELDDTIRPAPEFDEWMQEDFRNVEFTEMFDLIFSNPPFSLVYEVTQFANSLLKAYGYFTLLIGSNFMFARTMVEKWLQDIRPVLEGKLLRRPSFKQIFAERRGDGKGKGTSAKDYCVYFFGGRMATTHLQTKSYIFAYYMLEEDVTPWLTFMEEWDYEDDPLEAVLVERPVTVQQALIRDAAEAKDSELKWDFRWSLLTANMFVWGYYYSDTHERLDMIDHYISKLVPREKWGEVWDDVMAMLAGVS